MTNVCRRTFLPAYLLYAANPQGCHQSPNRLIPALATAFGGQVRERRPLKRHNSLTLIKLSSWRAPESR